MLKLGSVRSGGGRVKLHKLLDVHSLYYASRCLKRFCFYLFFLWFVFCQKDNVDRLMGSNYG